MGGEPWFYFVPYQADINNALQELRRSEFKAGRYNPVPPFLDFPINAGAPEPGAQHASIEARAKVKTAASARRRSRLRLLTTKRNSRNASPHCVARAAKCGPK
jgi:hypothetical protein